MANRFQNIFKRYKTITAKLAGSDYLWNVLRPNYAIADNTPTIANSNIKLFLEPTQQNDSRDKLPGVEYYSVTGNSALFQVGDVLQLPGGAVPLCTVVSMPDEQEFLAVKMPKIGNIDDMGTSIYSNVYFDFLSANTDGNPEFKTPTSLNDPRRRLMCFNRPGVIEGMTFTDTDQGDVWGISLIDRRDSIMIIYVDNPNRQ